MRRAGRKRRGRRDVSFYMAREIRQSEHTPLGKRRRQVHSMAERSAQNLLARAQGRSGAPLFPPGIVAHPSDSSLAANSTTQLWSPRVAHRLRDNPRTAQHTLDVACVVRCVCPARNSLLVSARGGARRISPAHGCGGIRTIGKGGILRRPFLGSRCCAPCSFSSSRT